MYTNIDDAPGMISGKCGKRRKRRNLHHFGKIIRGVGTSLMPIYQFFIMFPPMGGGWPFSGRNFRVFAAETVLIYGNS